MTAPKGKIKSPHGSMQVCAPWHAHRRWGRQWAKASSELIYTPVWIPQLAMSMGAILLAIALWDTLYRMLITGKNPIVSEAVE